MKIIICVVVGLFAVSYFYELNSKSRGGAISAGSLYGFIHAFQSEREAREAHVDGVKAAYEEKHELAKIEIYETVNLSLLRARFVRDAEETRTLAAKAVAEADAWENKVVPLLTNRRGRLLARNAQLVAAFSKAFNADGPELGDARFVSGQVDLVYESLKKANFEKADDISEMANPFGDWKRRSTEFHDFYRRRRIQIEGLVMEAQQLPPSDEERHSLQQSLDNLERRQAALALLPVGALVQSTPVEVGRQ